MFVSNKLYKNQVWILPKEYFKYIYSLISNGEKLIYNIIVCRGEEETYYHARYALETVNTKNINYTASLQQTTFEKLY